MDQIHSQARTRCRFGSLLAFLTGIRANHHIAESDTSKKRELFVSSHL